MGNKSFFKNTFLLTASNITTGLLGFIFSVTLSKVLGAEGVGLYSLVMPIYNLFIALMTAGVVAAISQVTAVYFQKGDGFNLKRTIRNIGGLNFSWASIVAIVVFFLTPLISQFIINDGRTLGALRVICPAMVCIALSNILKGFFLGTSEIVMPALIDILEKAMRTVILVGLVFFFKAKTISSLVTIAYVAMCIGELQSLLLLFIYYLFASRKLPQKTTYVERRSQLLFDVLKVSVPLCLNGFLTSIFAAITTLIIPRRLIVAGFSYSTALSMIGKFSGMALAIVTFPLIVVSSINSLLIPDLSQTLSNKNYYNASRRIKQVLKIALILGLFTLVLCHVVPNELGQLLFNRTDLGLYIKVCALSAPIMFTAVTMFGILNGLSKQGTILKNSIIIEIFEITSLFILLSIPSINILGYGITMIISYSVNLFINFRVVRKNIDIDIKFSTVAFYIAFAFVALYILKALASVCASLSMGIKTLIILLFAVLIFSALAFFALLNDEE